MGKKKKKKEFDPRSMEKMLSDLSRMLRGKEFDSVESLNQYLGEIVASGGPVHSKPRDALDEAQELIYQAWELEGRERVELAYQALEICEDCADAYIILAEEVASSRKEMLRLYQQAVEAGRRALGEKVFKESVGHFWGLVSTRPYMRALCGLAQCLWSMGKKREAIEKYYELLRLNPNDNQGIRYLLINCLLEMGRNEEARKLLKRYEDDPTACWAYSEALLTYRDEGASSKADSLLKKAFDCNPHVPAYLLRKKKLPAELPMTVGFGDESEAVDYAADAMKV